MTFWAGFFRGVLVTVAWVFLSGCTPSGTGPLDEEKEPHFLAGKSRIGTLDYKGAIECFEKALQVNPKSASAHFELAWLFDQKEVRPAEAICHYEHFLELRPKADNADLAKQRVLACKQALAETVSLGPLTDKMQRQFEQVTEDNKRLTQENKRLTEDLEKWSSYAARLQTLTNYAAAHTTAPALGAMTNLTVRTSASRLPGPEPGSATTTSTSAAVNRTHSVKAGETASLIARKYGVKLEALLAVNPNLDTRRLRVGQALRIPGS